MRMPESPLSGLCNLSCERHLFGGRVSALRLCVARNLLLETAHYPDPFVYGVGIEERDVRTPRQGDSSTGKAGRGHDPGLHAPMMLRSGKDLLHWPVTYGPFVVLALYGDTLASTIHDNVDALIPYSPEHHRSMSHRLEEVGHEDLELGSAHGANCF